MVFTHCKRKATKCYALLRFFHLKIIVNLLDFNQKSFHHSIYHTLSNNSMERKIVFTELMIFLIVFIFSVFFGSALLFPFITKLMGIDNMAAFISGLSDTSSAQERFLAKIVMILNQFFTFLLPSLIFLLWIHQRKTFQFLQLNRPPNIQLLLLGGLLMMISFPLAQGLLQLNQMIALTDNLTNLEEQANNTAQVLLIMNTPSEFLMSLLTIAVMPAICEEIFFRGILQNYLSKQHPHIGILLAAFIFAAIHMQWASFLPRFFLGILLGYLFYYSKNLWLPIFAHFVLNAMQIVPVYVMKIDITDEMQVGELPLIVIIGSLVLSTMIGYVFYKKVETFR